MAHSYSFQTLGSLTKEEKLQTVEHNIVQNTLVLESLEPFPGYHGENLPSEAKPESLYLITSKKHSTEDIFRTSQSLYNYRKLNFDVCPGELTIYNNHYFCIRLRGTKDYSNIADIQGCYLDKGFGFLKKRNIQAIGLIRIEKVFSLEQLSDYIYKDLDDELTYYINIPYHFSWNLFKQVSLNVKNNLDNSNFDAALGFIYQKNIIDFVRLYIKNPDVIRLQNIREKYIEEIRKIQAM